MQPPGGENLVFSPIFVSLHIIKLHIHIAHANTQQIFLINQSVKQALPKWSPVVTAWFCGNLSTLCVGSFEC